MRKHKNTINNNRHNARELSRITQEAETAQRTHRNGCDTRRNKRVIEVLVNGKWVVKETFKHINEAKRWMRGRPNTYVVA
jgi:hypothetical protein